MNESEYELVSRIHREAAERLRDQPLPRAEPPTIHYTELPEARPGDVLFHEWNTYRREVGRLVAEGHERRFVLIKDDTIVGVYDTWDAARAEGLERYLLNPFFVKQILSREPLLRVRGYSMPCRA